MPVVKNVEMEDMSGTISNKLIGHKLNSEPKRKISPHEQSPRKN